MNRPDGRKPDELRPVRIQRGVLARVAGSVIIETGETRVLCTACVEEGVPEWRRGSGLGWVTAEYDMLPASTGQRRARNRGGKVDGRTQEIQRLIGRCIRAVTDFAALGERTIWIDCDVLQADGGTRTAAISGSFVAFADAARWCLDQGLVSRSPVVGQVAAVSVGRVNRRTLLDLCYAEDSKADVDFNVAMTDTGRYVEVQGSAEGAPFAARDMQQMLKLASVGVRRLLAIQRAALSRRSAARGRTQPGKLTR